MNRFRSRLIPIAIQTSILVFVSLLMSDWAGAVALAQDTASKTVLRFAGPDEIPLGNVARLVAVLEDSNGDPITGATVRFTVPSSFAGTVAEMEVGEATTGPDGVVTFDYQLRSEGRNQFIARFFGDAEHPPAETRTEILAMGTAQLSDRSAGVRVPFFGAWTLIVVICAVWVVYFLAMRLVSQIPERDVQINTGGNR